jgi:hypothetical protein
MAAHAQQPRPGTEPEPVSTEAEELHRIISTSVRDMLDAFRIQAAAGPVTDKALEEIVFRAEYGVLQSLAPYPRAQRVALLPSVVRMLLTTFVENVAGADGSAHAGD